MPFTQRNQDGSFFTQDKPRADSWAHHGLFTAPIHSRKQKEATTSQASLIQLEAHEAGSAARRWLDHCWGLGWTRRWQGAAGETGLEVAIAVQDTARHDGQRCHGWRDTVGGYGEDVSATGGLHRELRNWRGVIGAFWGVWSRKANT